MANFAALRFGSGPASIAEEGAFDAQDLARIPHVQTQRVGDAASWPEVSRHHSEPAAWYSGPQVIVVQIFEPLRLNHKVLHPGMYLLPNLPIAHFKRKVRVARAA